MDESQQQRHRSEMDAHEVSRQLQRQLEDVQRTRDDERKQLLQRLEDQRAQLGNDIKELRDRNAAVSLYFDHGWKKHRFFRKSFKSFFCFFKVL